LNPQDLGSQLVALRELVPALEQVQEKVQVLAQEQARVLGLAAAQVQALVKVLEQVQVQELALALAQALALGQAPVQEKE
jgi:hypothetical protein